MPKFPIEIPDERYFERLIPCREACPVHTDARGYVQAIGRGEYSLAYRIARAPNPFASICGRVCGAPCERACRRGAIDEPVAIRALKRFATERHGVEALADPASALAYSTAPGSVEPRPSGHKVAIVGGGAGGFACAHDLARLGHQVTVLEADAEPGGMLRTGVPRYRLPEQLWRREIESILALGVELRCTTRVGKDVTLDELRAQGHEAVVLAAGLQRSRGLDLPGKELDGIVGGLEFLRAFNAGELRPPMGRVVVIGGGNVAYDCARSALRLTGTTGVTLTCLEALHEMPADAIEISEGEEEGLERLNRRGPVAFVGDAGRLTGLQTRDCSRVFDEKGAFSPELVAGSEKVIPCDTVIVAIGQSSDSGFATGVAELSFGRGGVVTADRVTGATRVPWLFAIGDVALGPGLFIDAIAHGQRAAAAVHRRLLGIEKPAAARPSLSFEPERVREGLRPDYLRLARQLPPAAPARERAASAGAPVELSYDERTAREQAARCLRCEVETVFDGRRCVLCGGCADVCPTWCLRLVPAASIGLGDRLPGHGAIIKDEDRCIRCGFCVERCPTGAIRMERLCGFEPWACKTERSGRV